VVINGRYGAINVESGALGPMFISFLNNLAQKFVLNYAVWFAASDLCDCFSICKSSLGWPPYVYLGFGFGVLEIL
jgi:hypothetical protein